jgi:uncharacterized membrane protein (DUF4010 family)
MDVELFQRLGLALAIGFLVGLERGWRARDVAEGGRVAGLRTYTLGGLLGGVSALLSASVGGWAFAGIGLPFAAALVLFTLREQAGEADFSITGVVAGLMVFALGAYAVLGNWQVAAAAAVATTVLLAFKSVLHGWLRRLTWEELRSAFVLLAMTFVALPLVPDRAFGPAGAVNPRELWILTIAMAGVSFVAYVATKVLGPMRGLLVGSAAGALVSSTAVTLNLARLTRGKPEAARPYAGAALLAGAVMATRVAVIAGVLAPPLALRIGAPVAAFAVVSLGLALVASLRTDGKAMDEPADLKSPFDLGMVVKFALLLGIVMAVARLASAALGSESLLMVAGVAGLVDVDAITLTVSQMARHMRVELGLGAAAVLLAVLVDSLSKAAIAAVVGGRRFSLWFGAGTLAAALPAAALYWRLETL